MTFTPVASSRVSDRSINLGQQTADYRENGSSDMPRPGVCREGDGAAISAGEAKRPSGVRPC